MGKEYEPKVRGILGLDGSDSKAIRILNRCLEWRADGIFLEADPRHAELIVAELGLQTCGTVSTPAVKTDPDPASPKLDLVEATKRRRSVAKCNFLSADTADINFATKECAQGMSAPTRQQLEQLKRLGRHLKGHMRYTMKFVQQNHVFEINAFNGSDWAGDTNTRKSTSGGMICIGDHCVGSYSVNQPVVALSSGEADLYATNKAAASVLGLRSLLRELGIDLQIRILTDSNTSKAMIMRRGLGNIKHIATNELWLQQHVAEQ